MSYSLQLGFESLPDGCEAAVILLGDQPVLAPATIRSLIAGRGERPIIASWSEGRPAPPVLIERTHFRITAEATGDRGLRDLLLAHPEWVAAVELPATPDVDTQADLGRIRGG
jgi:molybdenum cofactor cytidylyltransferase